jgi:hypothetical protein
MLEEDNIARRNLILISAAMITYFYAGGNLAEGKLTFQLISLEFSEYEKLGHLAWVLFAWVWLRYYQLSRINEDRHMDLNINSHSGFLCWLAKRVFLRATVTDEFRYELRNYVANSASINYDENEDIFRFVISRFKLKNGLNSIIARETDISLNTPFIINLSQRKIRFIRYIMIIYTSFNGRIFTTYIMPHIFAFIVIIMGVSRFLA